MVSVVRMPIGAQRRAPARPVGTENGRDFGRSSRPVLGVPKQDGSGSRGGSGIGPRLRSGRGRWRRRLTLLALVTLLVWGGVLIVLGSDAGSPTSTPQLAAPQQPPTPAPVQPPRPSGQPRFVSLEGNDRNSGSRDSPFRTLTAAASAAKPGDTILVRGGTYSHERVFIRHSGVAGSPITVKPYPGERVVLDGQADTVNGANLWFTDDGLFTVKASHVVVEGFEIKNAPTHGIHATGENLVIRKNLTHHIWMNGIAMLRASNSIIEDNEVHNTAMNNFRDRASVWAGGLTVQSLGGEVMRNVTIRRNFVHELWGEAIYLEEADGFTIQDNIVRNAHSISYGFTTSSNGVFERNIAYADGNWATSRYPARAFTWGGEDLPWGDGSNHARNVIVRNNLFVNQGDAAFMRMASTLTYSNFQFIGNTFYNAGLFAGDMLNGSGSGNVLKNNIIKGGVHLMNRDTWDISNNSYPDGNHYGEPLGANALTGSPLFVNPGGFSAGDYALQASSPVIGKGVTLADLPRDMAGALRRNPPSLGAMGQ